MREIMSFTHYNRATEPTSVQKIFVGNQEDYESSYFVPEQWGIVLAAKEPWHRQTVGYTGRACDKSHPEYLMARRDNKLILNLVDAPKPEFFDKRIIDAALDFFDEQLKKGKNIFICCNQGESRSPSICLLYLIKHGIIKGDTLEDCEAEFMKVYPEYNPGAGMRGFVKEHWREYAKFAIARFKLFNCGARFGKERDGIDDEEFMNA